MNPNLKRVKAQGKNTWEVTKQKVLEMESTSDTYVEDNAYWEGYAQAVRDLGIGTEKGHDDFLDFLKDHYDTIAYGEVPDLKQEKLEEDARDILQEQKKSLDEPDESPDDVEAVRNSRGDLPESDLDEVESEETNETSEPVDEDPPPHIEDSLPAIKVRDESEPDVFDEFMNSLGDKEDTDETS